jgi:hypothetical protein
MNDQIKEILKAEKLSWDKFSKANTGEDRSNFKTKVEGWANKLNTVFNAIGYEVKILKIKK